MAVSQQIKSDLGSSDPGTPAHTDFVRFVRAIIGLIKSYGPETRIDPFFLEVSPVYSPSPEDPRLQIAGITRYTLRIAEKDATATRQLLYFLINNFKVAIANGRLEEECRLLEAAMKEQSTLTFMLETMVPTLLVMSVEEPSGWPMLQTYCQALRNFLDSSPRLLRFTDADYPSILNIVNMVGVYLSRILSHAYDNISSMMHCATHMLALVDSLLPYLDVAATKVADPATAHRIGSQRDHFIYSVQDAGIRMEETGMIGLAEPLPVPLSSIDAILDPMIPLGNATTVRELAMTLAKELHGRLLQCNGHIHLLNAHPCAPTISRQATDCPEGPRVDLCESGEFGDGRALEQVLRVIRSKWGPGEYRSARQVDMPVRGLNWCNRMQRAPWRKQWQRWGVGIKAEQYSLGVTLF